MYYNRKNGQKSGPDKDRDSLKVQKSGRYMTHLPLYLINLQYFTKMKLTPEKWIILSS